MTRRILVVDDEPDIRDIAALALEHLAGWTVLTASTGSEALAVAARDQPEVILLDVMLPGMDGTETAMHLARGSTTAHIPILFLTAKVTDEDRIKLESGPVRGILNKPFDPTRLAEDIYAALGWA